MTPPTGRTTASDAVAIAGCGGCDACDDEAVTARGRCGWLVAAFGSWPRLEVALQRRGAREGLHGCGSGFQC